MKMRNRRTIRTAAAGVPLLRTNAEIVANINRRNRPAPNPYAGIGLRAAEVKEALSPDSDPTYQPYGQPPDSYAIGIAIRRLQREDR
jgi:hypothetical protein